MLLDNGSFEAKRHTIAVLTSADEAVSRAQHINCVSAVERPRERLPCRPPGRLRAGAPLQPASWPHRLSSLLSKLFPFIRAAAVGRSRPAESSTSLFDRLGVTSSTGTSQVSSAPSHPSPRSGAFTKNSGWSRGLVIGPLFSPSTAAPRLAPTLVSDGACGLAGAGMLSVSDGARGDEQEEVAARRQAGEAPPTAELDRRADALSR